MLHHFDVIAKRRQRCAPHGGANGMTVIRKRRDRGAAKKAGSAGNQQAACRVVHRAIHVVICFAIYVQIHLAPRADAKIAESIAAAR